MPEQSSSPAPTGATPTTILALAWITDEPCCVHWIHAMTLRALVRRKLVFIHESPVANGESVWFALPTQHANMVVSAYCLAVDQTESRLARV